MHRVWGWPSGTASNHIVDAGRPPSCSGRSCDRCTRGAPRARASRPAGTSRASSIGATQTFDDGQADGQDPAHGCGVVGGGQLPGPGEGLDHGLRAGGRGRARQEDAGVGRFERSAEDPAVELGEHLHDQLVDHLVAVELVDVEGHDVTVEVGDDRRHLGQGAGQVGELHAEAVSAHRATLPARRFVDVAAG